MKSSKNKRVVGFFAVGVPGIAEVWRPREEDPEECSPAEAERRYRTLVRLMLAKEPIDGAIAASVHEQDVETGEYLRIMTADGSEDVAAETSKDACADLALLAAHAKGTGRSRVALGLRTSKNARALS